MGILDVLIDKQFQRQVARGLLDAGNRGVVAGMLGGPVDLATMALRPFGYSVEKPFGGSEWIGQKMQDAGIVSADRNPLAEGLASFAGPMGVQQAGPKLYAAEQAMRANAASPSPFNAATRGQGGGIPDTAWDSLIKNASFENRQKRIDAQIVVERSKTTPDIGKIADLLETKADQIASEALQKVLRPAANEAKVLGTAHQRSISDIEALADSKNIPWDNKAFTTYTKRTVGVRHLDDLTQDELNVMYNALEKRPAKPEPLDILTDTTKQNLFPK